MASKTPANVTKVYEKARSEARAKSNGVAYLATKDVAVLIRHKLKQEFPGVTFSVRSSVYSGGSSINVSWTDGPRTKEVEAVIGCYSFSGFDGMIDMKYGVSNWLSPNGDVRLAETRGTEGSGGIHSESIGDDPKPGDVMVRGGTDHVFCHRDLSEDYELRLAHLTGVYWLGADFCTPLDNRGRVEDFRLDRPSEYFRTLMHRYDAEYGLAAPRAEVA